SKPTKPAVPVTDIARSDSISCRASPKPEVFPRLFTRAVKAAAILTGTAIAIAVRKPYQGGEFDARRQMAALLPPSQPGKGEMRRILLSTLKILVSAALLYFSLRKINLAELISRIDASSIGWIGVAIAVSFLQIFIGVLRWREISAECG